MSKYFYPYDKYGNRDNKLHPITNTPSGSVNWGDILGKIENQKDLYTILDSQATNMGVLMKQIITTQRDLDTETKTRKEKDTDLANAINDLKNDKQDKIDFSPQIIDISMGNLPPAIEYKNAKCIYSQITQIGKVRAVIKVGVDFECFAGTPIFSNLPKLDGAEENVAYWEITDSNGVVQFGIGFNSTYGNSVLVNLEDYNFKNGTTLYLDGIGIWPPYKK